MIKIDDDLFKKMYFEDLEFVSNIAKVFNCTQSTIFRYIKNKNYHREKSKNHNEDLTGQRFNFLTALEYVKNDKFGKAIWLCECECGKKKNINAACMKKNLTKSCGCFKRKKNSAGYELISGAFWKKLEKSAATRSYEMTITIEEAWNQFLKQDGKCALSNVPITLKSCHDQVKYQTASPDRIDSKLGYTQENFQWVHKRINRIKNILSKNELLFWCDKIIKNNNEKITEINVNEVTWD